MPVTADTEAFLSGQGVPVPLDQIETELERLWGPSAEGIMGSEPENPTLTRLSLANLVVACLGADGEHVSRALDTVLTRHPCRAILLRLSSDPDRRVSAEVAAQCSLPAPGLPQVCSEQIILNAGVSSLDLLPGAVRPLLEPDLPLILWWAGDPRPHWELFLDLADEATRLISDFSDPAESPELVRLALDPVHCGNTACRDMAWYGMTRWRELIAQFFDGPSESGSLSRIRQVDLVVASPANNAPPRSGAWIIAWLAGQLGWKPLSRTIEGSELKASFDGKEGIIHATVRVMLDPALSYPQVREVQLTAVPAPGEADEGNETFHLMRIVGTPEVRIETCSASRCSLPRLVHASEWDDARRMAAALESRLHNPPYHDALPHLFWLLGC